MLLEVSIHESNQNHKTRILEGMLHIWEKKHKPLPKNIKQDMSEMRHTIHTY